MTEDARLSTSRLAAEARALAWRERTSAFLMNEHFVIENFIVFQGLRETGEKVL